MTELLDTPYWWEAAPRPEAEPADLPARVDVVVVGSGYTGCSAACELARGGREVLMVERDRPGEGASSRNAGILSGSLRTPFSTLARRAGLDHARARYGESVRARAFVRGLIEGEGLDCDFRASGRLVGALSPADYERLAREADLEREHLGIDAFAVPRAEIHDEVGTDLFHGATVHADIGIMHPGRYHLALLERAEASGTLVRHGVEVLHVAPDGDGFRVDTPRGAVRARDVVAATNAYTTGALPWWRNRVVPVASQMAATVPLGNNVMARVSPRGRAVLDSHRLFHYHRPSPDGTRLLIGGRYGGDEARATRGLRALKRYLARVFPDLAGTPLTHCWYGLTGFPRDLAPHIGVHGGVHYAMAFCGSGAVWGVWLGRKIALRLLGDPDAHTVFDAALPAIPLYRGRAWFLPPVMGWFALRDRLGP